MASSWSYDPLLIEEKDYVRYLIGDTDERHKLVYDEEIQAILDRKGNDTRATAISLCESLAARYSQFTDVRAGQTTANKTAVSDKFMTRATQLRRWKVKGFVITTQTQKDLNEDNIDRLTTNTTRDMDANT